MKRSIYISVLTLAFALGSCEIDEQVDPNGPSLGGILENSTVLELNTLINGIQASMRNGLSPYVTATGSIARELYLFDADPRNLQDLFGLDGTTLDNNTFYLTGPYISRYRTVKNCNILVDASNNAIVPDSIANGYQGFANTIKAHELLLALNMLNDNGIRIDVNDPDNLGPFVSKAEALTQIASLLDQAVNELEQAGNAFSFSLSTGFDNFNTPNSFITFNRAIAARVALYREDYEQTLSLLDNSFFGLDEPLNLGPKYIFSTAGGDLLNPIYRASGQNADQIIVNDDFIANAEEGDQRVAEKTRLRDIPDSQGGFNGLYESTLYDSPTDPIDIIRNEELVLIYAEANLQLGELAEAVTALNVIRNAAGLADYSGPVTQATLIDEVLQQRRYSLFSEGHRFIDLRRYGRLNEEFVVVDPNRNPDSGELRNQTIFEQFPVPLSEGV
ncbi:MAG: RagB/SusD family nutrient uptake outer membrane protein [Tunicatimonas sp.]